MTYPSTEEFEKMARVHDGGPKIFCETGTWHAHSLRRVKSLFERRISIEIDENLVKAARRLVPDDDAWIITGDSRELLPLVCRVITEPIFFWLDAHYQGASVWTGGPPGTEGTNDKTSMPLLVELETVLSRQQQRDIIAIDDWPHLPVDWPHIIKRLTSAGLTVDTSAPTYLVARGD